MCGKAVRLRALTGADLESLRGFINDPEVLQFSNVYRPISDAQQEAWWKGMTADPNVVWFGIDDITGPVHALVGTCCLVDLDMVSRQAELRLRIGDKKAWGRSLGSEACSLLVAFGFQHLNLERIWLRVFAPNERALRLYQKLGFVIEGRLRRAWHFQGVTGDAIVMGLLRDEWRPAQSP
jgi:RimJ/RimL family protein N-acetyltransferase